MEEFKQKLNVVLDLLIAGELKKDVDDTVFEKLLSILKTNCKKNCTIIGGNCDQVGLLKSTKFLLLFENYLKVIIKSSSYNLLIPTFAIRALGNFLAHKEAFAFIAENSNLLPFLDHVYSSGFAPHEASVQSALLSCLKGASGHSRGIKWVLEIEGIVEKIFDCFSARSCYVRKDAVSLLSSVLVHWYSEEITDDCTIYYLVDSLIEDHIFPTLKGYDHSYVKDCCISLLRTSMEKNKNVRLLFCQEHKLMEEIIEWLQCVNTKSQLPENMILLIADCCFYSQISESKMMTNLLRFFTEHYLLSSAMHLATSLLIREHQEKSVCSGQIDFIWWPLSMSLGILGSDSSNRCQEVLTTKINNKKEWMALVHTSLICSRNLICILDEKALGDIISMVCKLLNEHYVEEKASHLKEIFKDKKLCQSLLDLIVAFTQREDFSELDDSLHQELIKGLIHTVENSSDPNITSSALLLVKECMKVADINNIIPEEFGRLLLKRLLSPHWSIVDNSLEVVLQIVARFNELNIPWRSLLCSKDVFGIVWNLAINSAAEGYVRATAIKILISYHVNDVLWSELVSSHEVNTDEFMAALFTLAEHEDRFIQRAVVSSFSEWLRTSKAADSKYYPKVLGILLEVMRIAADRDSQITALTAWQFIANHTVLSVSTLTDRSAATRKIIQTLIDDGYVSSLLFAMHDSDITVQSEALRILLDLRNTMSQMGVTEKSLALTLTTSGSNSVPVSHSNCDMDTTSWKSSSQEEKNLGIDYVINSSTLTLIQNIMVTKKLKSTNLSSKEDIVESGSEARFWEALWSNELELKLALCNQSSDIYVNDPIKLLDDIIAAKVDINESYMSDSEYQEIDCY